MVSPCESKLNNSKPKMDRIPTYHLDPGPISENLFIIKYITFQNLFMALHTPENKFIFFKWGEKIYIITEFNITSIVHSRTKLRSCSEAIHAAVHFNLLVWLNAFIHPVKGVIIINLPVLVTSQLHADACTEETQAFPPCCHI